MDRQAPRLWLWIKYKWCYNTLLNVSKVCLLRLTCRILPLLRLFFLSEMTRRFWTS